MNPRDVPSPGDRFFTAVAYGLAAASVMFAGTMIVSREAALAPTKTAQAPTSSPDRAEWRLDPITTGSISRTAKGFGHPLVPRVRGRGPEAPGFRVVSAADGMALVEITDDSGARIIPVRKGGTIPGAGRVLQVLVSDNQWKIVTDRMVIGAETQ